MYKDKIQPIGLTSRASSTLTAGYQSINPNGLPQACEIIYLTSSSSTEVTVSFDGVNDHEILVATAGRIPLFAQNNAQPKAEKSLWPKGTVVYVKGTAGTGNIYLSGYYN